VPRGSQCMSDKMTARCRRQWQQALTQKKFFLDLGGHVRRWAM